MQTKSLMGALEGLTKWKTSCFKKSQEIVGAYQKMACDVNKLKKRRMNTMNLSPA